MSFFKIYVPLSVYSGNKSKKDIRVVEDHNIK